MKTLNEIINQEPIFVEDFDSLESVRNNFCIDDKLIESIKIIYASYYIQQYEGYAYVLFVYENKLYEVYGSHCSCYGLEGQFDFNEPVTLEELKLTLENESYHGYFNDRDVLMKILGLID